jgi:hypothetical protein
MHKFFTSLYDASIYLQQPDQNTGRDELLEVGKVYYGSIKDVYRTLIKFDMNAVSESFVNNGISGGWKAYLNLKATRSEEIPLEYTIYANAISQSWAMGTGTKFDNISSDGVSWNYRNGIDKWQEVATGAGATFVVGSTGSYDAAGGTWYTASEASQSYNYEPDDVRMDVSGIVNLWLSGSLPNNGFVVHHSLNNESDTTDYGALKFFSKETNTIYEPKLEITWDDSVFVTGSLTSVTGSISDDDYKIVFTNLKTKYAKDSIVKIRLKGRDAYPMKSFGTSFEYDQTKYLPTSSYYQIEDYVTGDVIFPFGDYTKISCDSNGNYFKMDLSTLPENRTYKVKLKVIESGISTIIDEKYVFEII